MNRITRTTNLTPEQAAKYRALREQVATELPALIARHHERTTGRLGTLLGELKAAREAKGLSLADLAHLTGLDAAVLGNVEGGPDAPTVEAVARYAEAVGKRLVLSLTDA